MLTEAAEIQQSTLNWIDVFDNEFKGCIMLPLQWQLFPYLPSDSWHIYQPITDNNFICKLQQLDRTAL